MRYYSLQSLNYLFKKNNLEIIEAKEIPTHGGSIRVYAARKGYYDILKFMISNGMYIDKWCTVEAIKNGHIECLELLLEKHYYSCVKYHMVTHLSMNMNKLNLDKYPLVLKFFVDNSETLLTFSELDKYVKDYLYLKFINSM